jgi:hypothetical protein
MKCIARTLALVRNRPSRQLIVAGAALVAFIVFVWADAFGQARHELRLLIDAQGAPASVIETGEGDIEVPLRYPGVAHRWEVAITAPGERSPGGYGAEVWIQSIGTDKGPLGWDAVDAPACWTRKESPMGTGGTALVSYAEGTPCTMRFACEGSELVISYTCHKWTGPMDLTIDGVTRRIDTWSDGFAKREIRIPAPPGPTDRITGREEVLYLTSNQLSGGLTVGAASGNVAVRGAWLDGTQRIVCGGNAIQLPPRVTLVGLPALGMAIASTILLAVLVWLFSFPARKNPLWTFIAAIALFKLWLIAGDEIRASLYDGRGYMLSALNGFWSDPFSLHGYDRQPVYPLFISLSRSLGIPLRIGIELLHLGACLTIATALPRLALPRWSAGAAFALLALTPLTLPVYAFGYQDAGYAPLYMAFTGALLHTLPRGKGRLRAGICTGVLAALVWNCRPEHILTAFALALGALLVFACEYMQSRDPRESARGTIRTILPAPLLILALTLVFAALGRVGPMGAFAASNFQLGGFTRLYNELLAITPDHPEAYHPVPTDARMRAYEASPSFALMRDALEGPVLDTYCAVAARGNEGQPGDYGVFFFWGLREAPWHLQTWESAASLDRYYAECADDLLQAREAGAYPSRRVWVAFIEPDASLWLPYIGEGISMYWGMLTRTKAAYLPPEDEGVEGWIFDGAALRRTALSQTNASLWTTPKNDARSIAKNACAMIGGAATWAGAIALFPALAVLAMAARKRPSLETILPIAVLILVAAAFAARFALVSLMHATAFGAEARYILPVAAFPALALVVSAAALLKAIPTLRKTR